MARAFLDESAKQALGAAARGIEERSSAEVVVVARPFSGSYRHSDPLFGTLFAWATLWFAYTEYWTLIRGAQVRGSPRADKQCPSCAAPLKVAMGGNCEHCGVHVTTAEFDWVLSKIEQDDSYRG